MKLVFLIVCHKMSASLIYNLKKFSGFKNSIVIVHIDRKSSLNPEQLVHSDNIYYYKYPLDIKWGSDSQIKVTLELLSYAQNFDFDYVSLMSGEDVFIRDEEYFIDFLKANKDKDFIGFSRNELGLVDPISRVKYRYPKVFFDKSRSKFNFIARKFTSFLFRLGFFKKAKIPYDRFCKGSNWFTVRRSTANIILNEVRSKRLMDFYEGSFCADEVFIQTIVYNLKLHTSVYRYFDCVDDNRMSLRYVDWSSGPNYPRLLDKLDLASDFDKDIFFVRKIDSSLSSEDLGNLFD